MSKTSSYPSTAPSGGVPQASPPSAPRLGSRVLGWSLMTLSLGLVSCQSLFYL